MNFPEKTKERILFIYSLRLDKLSFIHRTQSRLLNPPYAALSDLPGSEHPIYGLQEQTCMPSLLKVIKMRSTVAQPVGQQRRQIFWLYQ